MTFLGPTRRELLAGAGTLALSRATSFGKKRREGPPNVLFLIADQHRADAAGFAGDRAAYTPALDRLAREGVRFDELYCHNPLCVPARQSLITGLPSYAHGWYGNVAGFPEDQTTLASHWNRHGYETALIGKGHMNTHDFDHVVESAQMFAAFRERHPDGTHPGRAWMDAESNPYSAIVRLANPLLVGPADAPEHYMERDVVAESRRWLTERDRSKPFFLWASFTAPHPPRFPPAEWLERFRERPVTHWGQPSKEEEQQLFGFSRDKRARGKLGELTPSELDGIVRAYYASLAFADQCIGELLDFLDESGLAENTLVVYTSDHGELLGDHGLLGKFSLYESASRVPGLIRLPSGERAGARVGGLVQHDDLMATLFELAGIPSPAGFAGESVGAALEGANHAAPDSSAEALCELYYWPQSHVEVQRDAIAVSLRISNLKYVWFNATEQALYDLAEDPREQRNLFADPAERKRADELHARVRELLPERIYVMRRQKERGPKGGGR